MKTKLPLTNKRALWLKNRDITLRGQALYYNAGLQNKYINQIKKLVKLMTNSTKFHLERLFKGENAEEFFDTQKEMQAVDTYGMDASISSKAKILMNGLTRKFTQLFNSKSKFLSEKMINETLRVSKSSLHGSLQKLSGGLSLKTGIVTKGLEEISTALIAENVSLIKSIPAQYFKDVTGSVMRSITEAEGTGIGGLITDLKKYEKITGRRAELIALDQTRKAYNTINKQKMTALGVKKFEWNHSGSSQKPRKSHEKINGHIFSFENLEAEQAALGVPENDRGLPGMPVYCRCTIIPVIDFNSD